MGILSKEQRQKISASLKGRKMPYVAEANRNRKYSDETRKKRSELMKARWADKKEREQLIQSVTKAWQNSELRSKQSKRQKDSFTSEKRLVYSKMQSGSGNPSWKGGINFRKKGDKKHLCSIYQEWCKSVKNRDNWKCKIANQDCHGQLEAHHILSWRDYPELRYEVNNGITLCLAHHPRRYAEEKRLAPYFQELVSVLSD